MRGYPCRRMLAAKLEEAGLKRPAVLFRHRGDSELGLISEGAIKVMIEHGPGDMSLIHPWDSSPARVKAWLEEVQPDVIVLPYAPHLEILKGIGYGLDGPLPVVTLGLRGPDDLLSGVDVQSYACGQAAMEMLNLELQLNRTGLEENVRTLMIDCDWVEREAFSRFRRPQVLHQERDR